MTEAYLLKLCKHSKVGKILPDALYVHVSALSALDNDLQTLEQLARKVTPQAQNATLVKFSFNKQQIAYLFYPNFDTDAHPALQKSIQVNLKALAAKERDYSTTHNPPVLHRKETFVSQAYPLYATFARLTQQEESLGLLENSSRIGFRQAWEQRLQEHNLMICDRYLACPIQTRSAPTPAKPKIQAKPKTQAKPKIQRHKAAIARVTASKPVRLAVEAWHHILRLRLRSRR